MLGIIHRTGETMSSSQNGSMCWHPKSSRWSCPPTAFAFRQAMGKVYRKRIDESFAPCGAKVIAVRPGDVDDLYAYVDVPREFAIADGYCRRSGASLYPVDMDFFSWTKLRGIDELTSPENVEKSLTFRDRPGRTTENVLASLYFRSGVTAFSYTDEMALRDGYMCRGIGVLAKRFSGKRFLHIAGWRHLVDPLGLYARFQPVKIFPYD